MASASRHNGSVSAELLIAAAEPLLREKGDLLVTRLTTQADKDATRRTVARAVQTDTVDP